MNFCEHDQNCRVSKSQVIGSYSYKNDEEDSRVLEAENVFKGSLTDKGLSPVDRLPCRFCSTWQS